MRIFEGSWILFHTAPWLLKKWWLLIDHFDAQALTPALPHQNSIQLAALYTLQHGLPRNTQFRGGFDHGQVPWRRLLHDVRAQFFGDANLPRRTWRNLLTRNEAICQPTVNAGCVHPQDLRCLTNRRQLSIR